MSFLDSMADKTFGRLQINCTPFKDCESNESSADSLIKTIQSILEDNTSSDKNCKDFDVFSELLQKLNDSVPPQLFPGICSSLQKSIHRISSVVHCMQQNSCYLYDTDSDEEQTCNRVLSRLACDRNMPTLIPSHEETSFLIKTFPHFPPMSVSGSPLLDISCYNIKSMEQELTAEFPIPSQSFEDVIWKEIESTKHGIDIPEAEVGDMFTILQLGLSSLVTELGGMNGKFSFINSKVPLLQIQDNNDGHVAQVQDNGCHEYSSDRGQSGKSVSLGGIPILSIADIELQLPSTDIELQLPSTLLKPTSRLPAAEIENIQPLENIQMIDTLVQKLWKPPTETVNTIVPPESQEPDDTILRGLKKSFRGAAQMIEDESNNLDNLKPSSVQGLNKTYNAESEISLARSHFQATTSAAKPVRNETQTIFATEIEDKLFHLLTDNISKSPRSFRIVQIGGPWVDVYKLSLSMMNGGWIHFHVMDCFIQMLSCNQSFMSHLPGHLYLQFLDYAVSSKLMEDYFDYNSCKESYLEILGFRLHETTLVTETATNASYNVAKHFRKLDTMAYNIYEFQLEYLRVPKCNFRYDSGIYVLQFMQTFDGTTMENFCNKQSCEGPVDKWLSEETVDKQHGNRNSGARAVNANTNFGACWNENGEKTSCRKTAGPWFRSEQPDSKTPRYLKSGPGNLEKDVERSFSYGLSRENIENAILGGP